MLSVAQTRRQKGPHHVPVDLVGDDGDLVFFGDIDDRRQVRFRVVAATRVGRVRLYPSDQCP
jgi:hypothetical protein